MVKVNLLTEKGISRMQRIGIKIEGEVVLALNRLKDLK